MRINDMFAIGMIYNDCNCNIYYGRKEDVLKILIDSGSNRVYGKMYNTEESMMNQMNYYWMEKLNAIIHKIEYAA